MNIAGLRTISTTVSDLDRSREFYVQALGFSVVNDLTVEDGSFCRLSQLSGRVRLATLQLGNESIELVQYLDVAPKQIPPDSQSNDLWFQHMAIVVRDMDQAYDHLRSFSIEAISSGPQTIPEDNPMAGGVRAFKFKDGDRHPLELIWFPPDKRDEKWQHGDALFLGIDHTAIAVSDTDKSLKFYRDLLGMTVVDSNLNSGDIQAQLDGLPVAQVQVTPLQPGETGAGLELLDYVKPGTGRAWSEDWSAGDLAHRHVVLGVEQLGQTIDYLRAQGVDVISPHPVDLPDAYGYSQGCLIKDPDGHRLLLAS